MGSENGGVVGMIEVIQSDFARLESETSATEAEAQKQYDEFMTDSSVDKAQKTRTSSTRAPRSRTRSSLFRRRRRILMAPRRSLTRLSLIMRSSSRLALTPE